jgi:hypothetical protein
MSVIVSNITLPVDGTYVDGTATANIGESNCPDGTLMASSTVKIGSKVTVTNKCTAFSIAENDQCTDNKQFILNSSLSPTLKNKIRDENKVRGNICVDVSSSCGINSELDENNNCITYLMPTITNTIFNKTTSSYSCKSPGISIDNKCYICKPGYTLNPEKKKCYKQ